MKLALVAWLIWGVFAGRVYESRLTLAPGLELVLNADALSVLFVTLSTVLWLVTTIYAIGYLEHAPSRSRFFGFFSLCVSATVGIALAGNLLTFVIFYGHSPSPPILPGGPPRHARCDPWRPYPIWPIRSEAGLCLLSRLCAKQ